MTCSEARRALLSAELDELRGEGMSAVAQHVRTCADCKAAAQQILSVTAALAERVERATVPARKRVRPSAWPVWVALPLAAAIASVLLVRDTDSNAPIPRTGAPVAVKAPVTRTIVNAPSNRNVAVIEATSKITVVWDLGAKGGS
jgi:hypothetical protein